MSTTSTDFETFSRLAQRLSVSGYAPGAPVGWSARDLARRARIVRETPCQQCGEARLAPTFWRRMRSRSGGVEGVAVGVCINRGCDSAQVVSGGER